MLPRKSDLASFISSGTCPFRKSRTLLFVTEVSLIFHALFPFSFLILTQLRDNERIKQIASGSSSQEIDSTVNPEDSGKIRELKSRG